MKKVALLFRRLVLSIKIRQKEIHIQDIRRQMRESPIPQVFDFRLLSAEVDLVVLRADYLATFPPGKRLTWETA